MDAGVSDQLGGPAAIDAALVGREPDDRQLARIQHDAGEYRALYTEVVR